LHAAAKRSGLGYWERAAGIPTGGGHFSVWMKNQIRLGDREKGDLVALPLAG